MLLDVSKNPTSVTEKIKAITDEMDKLTATNVKEATDLGKSYQEDIEQRKIAQPLKYGISILDYYTGGIRKKELTVIAARPSIGKTAFALQIAYNLAVKKNKVLFFPLEMSGSQLTERIACRETNISHEHLKNTKIFNRRRKSRVKKIHKLHWGNKRASKNNRGSVFVISN